MATPEGHTRLCPKNSSGRGHGRSPSVTWEAPGFPTGPYTLKSRDGELDVYEGSGADPTSDCSAQVGMCASIEITGSGRVLTLGKTPTCTGVGRYAFVVKGDTLTTKKVKDDCDARRPLVFDDRTWKRAG